MRFSPLEIKHLVKAWIAISLAFAVMLSLRERMFVPDISVLPYTFLISAIVVGLGFLLHELMHKYFAQKYQCWAEFRADDKMLLLAVGLSFFGFIFAAPGAVYIQGTHLSQKQNGIISLAGPATNVVLALLFLGLGYVFTNEMFAFFFQYGFLINAWLGLFNLLPFGPLDGTKVLAWNKIIYGLAIVASGVLVAVSWM